MKTLYVIVFLILSAATSIAGENPTSQYIKQGFEQLKAGKYQTAIRTFNSATKIDTSCAEAYEGIGEAYLGMGDNAVSSDSELIEKGVYNLKVAIKLNPKSAAAHYKLATAYLALNDKEKAVREYEILKSIDKEKASRLSTQISKYKAPHNYHFIGSSGSTRVSRSNNAAKKGPSGIQTERAAEKKERFTGTVEVFVTSWCPYCKKAIAYMQEKGIPYVAYDIEADAQAKKRFDDLGGRGFPLFLVGTKKFYVSDPKTIDHYLGQ